MKRYSEILSVDKSSQSNLKMTCPVCHESTVVEATPEHSSVVCATCGMQFAFLSERSDQSEVCPDTTVGRFVLKECLGQGGFGRVWRAYDPALDRHVAVKIPRWHDLTAADGEAFLREARAASQVRHPNVVAVHEVGVDGETLHLVSDLIDGESLAKRIAYTPPSISKSVAWCRKLASALQSVHNAGITHRDLKPDNILLDQSDEPFLSDFGLARRTDGDLTLTSDGKVVGTIAYLSPEAARGDAKNADCRSDIFSFGTILYQLLTNELPFRGQYHVALHGIIHEDPVPPRRLNRLIPRDLETICLKCLEKKPAARYQSATAIADELARFCDGIPIEAKPLGSVRRVTRWAMRRPHAAALLALLCALAIGGPIIAVHQARLTKRANDAMDAAVESKKTAQSSERRARRYAYAADIEEALTELDARNPALAKTLLEHHIPEAGQSDIRGFEWRYLWKRCHVGLRKVHRTNRPIDRFVLSDDGAYLGAYGYGSISAISILDVNSGHVKLQRGHDEAVGIHFDETRQEFLFADTSGHVQYFDSNGVATVPSRRPNQASCSVARLHLSSDFISVDEAGVITICGRNEPEPKTVHSLPKGMFVRNVAVSSDDRWCAVLDTSGSLNRRVFLLRLPSLELHWDTTLEGGEFVAFSQDCSKVLVGGSSSQPARVFSVSNGELVGRLENIYSSTKRWIGVSPDCENVAAVSGEGNVVVWRVDSRKVRSVLPHKGVRWAQWMDATTLVTAGRDGCLCWWDVGATDQARSLISETPLRNNWHASTSSDGCRLLTLSGDDRVRLWDTRLRKLVHTFTTKSYGSKPAIGPKGSVIGIPKRRGRTLFLQFQDSEPREDKNRVLFEQRDDNLAIGSFASSPDGRWLFVTDEANYPNPELDRVSAANAICGTFVDIKSGQQFTHSLERIDALKVAFSHDSQKIFSIGGDLTFRITNVPGGDVLYSLPNVFFSAESLSAMQVSQSEEYLAVGGKAGMVHLRNLRQQREPLRLSTNSRVFGLAFSPDEDTLVASSGAYDDAPEARGEIRFWDIESGQTIVQLGRDLHMCKTLCFTHDELLMTTVHFDGSIYSWEGASDEEVEWQRSSPIQ